MVCLLHIFLVFLIDSLIELKDKLEFFSFKEFWHVQSYLSRHIKYPFWNSIKGHAAGTVKPLFRPLYLHILNDQLSSLPATSAKSLD